MKIFKKICFLLSFLCLWSVTNAQNSFGGKAGIHFSKWAGDADDLFDDLGFNFGFQIGAAFEIAVTEKLSIQPEVLFIQKGVKSSFSDEFFGEAIESEDKINFNYLEIPILAKINLGSGEGTSFFVTLGPSFGYALNGKVKSKVTINGETETDSEDIEFEDDDGFNRFDVGLSTGVGVGLPVGSGKFAIEARYLLGLANLVEDDDDITIKNSGFGISVGYFIPLAE